MVSSGGLDLAQSQAHQRDEIAHTALFGVATGFFRQIERFRMLAPLAGQQGSTGQMARPLDHHEHGGIVQTLFKAFAGDFRVSQRQGAPPQVSPCRTAAHHTHLTLQQAQRVQVKLPYLVKELGADLLVDRSEGSQRLDSHEWFVSLQGESCIQRSVPVKERSFIFTPGTVHLGNAPVAKDLWFQRTNASCYLHALVGVCNRLFQVPISHHVNWESHAEKPRLVLSIAYLADNSQRFLRLFPGFIEAGHEQQT